MDSVQHDEQQHRFVLAVNGGEAVLYYDPIDPATVDFRSTYVPPVLRGKNVGTRLVCHALDWARQHDLRVVPSCWFVSNVAGRLPEYADILVR